MPSKRQMEQLHNATQALLDDSETFPAIQEMIDDATTSLTRDPFMQARARKMPVIAAFGARVAQQSIEMIQAGHDQTSVPHAVSPLEQYTMLTADLDEAAGHLVVNRLQNEERETALAASTPYFMEQRELVINHSQRDKLRMQRLGKVITSLPDIDAREALNIPMKLNARGLTHATVTRELLRIAQAEQELPQAEELVRLLGAKASSLSRLTVLPGNVFDIYVLGDELAQTYSNQIKEANSSNVSLEAWKGIISEYLQTGIVSPHVVEMSASLKNDIMQADKQTKTAGHCVAQFVLRPAGDSVRVKQYFQNLGVTLPLDGAFSTAQYQLLRAVEAGGKTLFKDPDYRAAIEAIARSTRT